MAKRKKAKKKIKKVSKKVVKKAKLKKAMKKAKPKKIIKKVKPVKIKKVKKSKPAKKIKKVHRKPVKVKKKPTLSQRLFGGFMKSTPSKKAPKPKVKKVKKPKVKKIKPKKVKMKKAKPIKKKEPKKIKKIKPKKEKIKIKNIKPVKKVEKKIAKAKPAKPKKVKKKAKKAVKKAKKQAEKAVKKPTFSQRLFGGFYSKRPEPKPEKVVLKKELKKETKKPEKKEEKKVEIMKPTAKVVPKVEKKLPEKPKEIMIKKPEVKKLTKKQIKKLKALAKKEKSKDLHPDHVKTYIPGFDELFADGIPKGNAVLVEGGPGVGKTIFCLQLAINACKRGKKVLYMSFEEPETNLMQHMKNFGWDPEKYIKSGHLRIKRFNALDVARSVEALLSEAKKELLIEIQPVFFPPDFKPDLICIDSLTSISSAFSGEESRFRIYMEQLFRYLEKTTITSFLIREVANPTHIGVTSYVEKGEAISFLSDGIIVLYNVIYSNGRRGYAMEVLKMRGEKIDRRIVKSDITKNGIVVYRQGLNDGHHIKYSLC